MSEPQTANESQQQGNSPSQTGSKTTIPLNWKTRPLLIQKESSHVMKSGSNVKIGEAFYSCGENSSRMSSSSLGLVRLFKSQSQKMDPAKDSVNIE